MLKSIKKVVRKMAGDDDNAGSSSGGGRGNDAPTFSLQFVNISMNAASQEEKQRNQRVVRSAAMKSFRRKQKSQRIQANGANSSDRMPVKGQSVSESVVKNERPTEMPRASPVPSDTSSSSDDRSLEAQLPTSASPTLNPFDIDFGIDEALQVGMWSVGVPQPSSVMSSPGIDRLGSGRIDPFRIYPVDVAGSNVSELIDHCKSNK